MDENSAEEQIKVLILCKDAAVAQGYLKYLERKHVQGLVTKSLQEALKYLTESKPNYAVLSVNYPHPKIEIMPLLFMQTFSLTVIAFSEDTSMTSSAKVNRAKTPHKLQAPINGYKIYNKIQQIIRGANKTEAEESEDSSESKSSENSGQDNNIHISNSGDDQNRSRVLKSNQEKNSNPSQSSPEEKDNKDSSVIIQKGNVSQLMNELMSSQSGPGNDANKSPGSGTTNQTSYDNQASSLSRQSQDSKGQNTNSLSTRNQNPADNRENSSFFNATNNSPTASTSSSEKESTPTSEEASTLNKNGQAAAKQENTSSNGNEAEGSFFSKPDEASPSLLDSNNPMSQKGLDNENSKNPGSSSFFAPNTSQNSSNTDEPKESTPHESPASTPTKTAQKPDDQQDPMDQQDNKSNFFAPPPPSSQNGNNPTGLSDSDSNQGSLKPNQETSGLQSNDHGDNSSKANFHEADSTSEKNTAQDSKSKSPLTSQGKAEADSTAPLKKKNKKGGPSIHEPEQQTKGKIKSLDPDNESSELKPKVQVNFDEADPQKKASDNKVIDLSKNKSATNESDPDHLENLTNLQDLFEQALKECVEPRKKINEALLQDHPVALAKVVQPGVYMGYILLGLNGTEDDRLKVMDQITKNLSQGITNEGKVAEISYSKPFEIPKGELASHLISGGDFSIDSNHKGNELSIGFFHREKVEPNLIADKDGQHLIVDPKDLQATDRLYFDLFLKLKAQNRMMKYTQKGGFLNQKQIDKFINAKNSSLYIDKSALDAYFEYFAKQFILNTAKKTKKAS